MRIDDHGSLRVDGDQPSTYDRERESTQKWGIRGKLAAARNRAPFRTVVVVVVVGGGGDGKHFALFGPDLRIAERHDNTTRVFRFKKSPLPARGRIDIPLPEPL